MKCSLLGVPDSGLTATITHSLQNFSRDFFISSIMYKTNQIQNCVKNIHAGHRRTRSVTEPEYIHDI